MRQQGVYVGGAALPETYQFTLNRINRGVVGDQRFELGEYGPP
jgi:hypothetical protein